MKKAVVIGVFIVCVLMGFLGSSDFSHATEPEDKVTGWWVLHEYHDRIMNNRCIGEFSFEQPVWSAIVLKVSEDSIYSWGSILPRKSCGRMSGDTMAFIDGINRALPLTLSSKKQELLISFTDSKGVMQTFHYRRMKDNELRALIRDLDDPTKRWILDRNYQDFFEEEFFTGTFTDLKGNVFTISKNGMVKNFGEWKTLWVDNFFGTTHWNGKRDMVRFEDNTVGPKFQDYNWRYRGDTLILRKFIGQDIEAYELSKEETRYIRVPLAN